MNEKAIVTRIPLKKDVNLDPVAENVYSLDDGDKGFEVADSQLIQNTGYHFENGVSTVHQVQTTNLNSPIYSYVTEGGNLIELRGAGNDPTSNAPMNGVYLDGQFLDYVPANGVSSVQGIGGDYDDLMLTDANPIGMKVLSNASGVPVNGTGGTSWTARTMPSSQQWSSVAYGNGTFVAVSSAASNVAATSPDGITWTSRTMPSARNWFSVTYGNGIFVAVAAGSSNNVAATSPDGITWTARTLSASQAWTSVIYGNGLFVAIGGTTNIASSSTDGITWTTRTLSASQVWNCITYGNGIFVAIGNSITASTSPDGITWTSRTLSVAHTWYSITYGNGLFVAVQITGGTDATTSPDGITWTTRTLSTSGIWTLVGFGNGVFIAFNGTGASSSTDGITWTTRTMPSNPGWSGFAYGNNIFVTVAGAAAVSPTTVAASSAITLSSSFSARFDEITSSGTIVNTTSLTINNAGNKNPITMVRQCLTTATPLTWSSFFGGSPTRKMYFLTFSTTSNAYTLIDNAGNQLLGTAIPVTWSGGTPKFPWAALLGPYTALTPTNPQFIICSLGYAGNGTNASTYTINCTGAGPTYTNVNTAYTYSWALLQSKFGFCRALLTGQNITATTSDQYLGYSGNQTLTSTFTLAPVTNTVTATAVYANQPAASGYAYYDIVHTDFHHYYSGYAQPTTSYSLVTDTPSSTGFLNGFGRLSFINENDNGGNKSSYEFRLGMFKSFGTGSTTYPASPQFISIGQPYAKDGNVAIGTPLSAIGEFDPSFSPQIGANWNQICWRWNNVYYIATISQAPVRPIQKITANLYKINTISPVNIVSISAKSLVLGSNDYDSATLVNGGSAGGGTLIGAVQIGWEANSPTAGSSIDLGGFSYFNTGAATITPLAISIPSMHLTNNYYLVSFFSGSGVTAMTLTNAWRSDGLSITSSGLLTGFQNQIVGLGTTYISNTTVVPVPLGTRYQGSALGTNSTATSQAFNETYITAGFQGTTLTSEWDGFILGNELQINAVGFQLFSTPYLFDGKNIYKLTLSNGGVQVPITPLVRADGLIYLTTSFQFAFFYSPFDNAIWAFNGGYTLEKFKRLDGMGAIQNAGFNAYTNTLTVLTSLFIANYVDGVWTAIPRIASMVPDATYGETSMRIYDTINGNVFGNSSNWWQYKYFQRQIPGTTVLNGIQTTETVYPLAYQTSYIGPDRNKKMALSAVTFSIYNEVKAPVVITTSLLGYDQENSYQTMNKIFQITPNMYLGGGYIQVLRIQPERQRFMAASFTLSCPSDIRIYDIHYHWTEDAIALPSAGRSL